MGLAGANVNQQRAFSGLTALMFAVAANRVEIVQDLILAKAQVNQTNDDGNTPLMIAAYKGHTEIVTHLMSAGADIYHQNKQGNTALKLAIKGDYPDIIHLLPNFQDELTPEKALVFAIRCGSLKVFQSLLTPETDI